VIALRRHDDDRVGVAIYIAQGAQAQGSDLPPGFVASDSGFIENVGQWDAAVKYHLRGGLGVWLTEQGFVYNAVELMQDLGNRTTPDGLTGAVQVEPGTEVNGHAVAVNFVGQEGAGALEGLEPLPGTYNWLNRDNPVAGAQGYRVVRYAEAFPGVDVLFTALQGDSRAAADVAQREPTSSHRVRTRRPSSCSTRVRTGLSCAAAAWWSRRRWATSPR